MRKIFIVSAVFFLVICSNQTSLYDENKSKEEFIAYMKKPSLELCISDGDIAMNDLPQGDENVVEILALIWPDKDSSLLSDTGWINCKETESLSCSGKNRFVFRSAKDNCRYPGYIGIEYNYSGKKLIDTVHLDSIIRFCNGIELVRIKRNEWYDNAVSWNSGTVINENMEIKYMVIAISNGLAAAEYYMSYPNTSDYEDGEPTFPEAYRYWHTAFSPEDNFFTVTSKQDIVPFVQAGISVKSYEEYDIRVFTGKTFR